MYTYTTYVHKFDIYVFIAIDISSGLLFPGGIIHPDCSVLAPVY